MSPGFLCVLLIIPDSFYICFSCIYQMLFALFGWLPSYQFTFSCLRAWSLIPASSSGRSQPAPSVTIDDIFKDKYTTDAWVYYICSTAFAITLLALTESVRARVIFSPFFNHISQKLLCCRTPESLKQPQAALALTDDDVRADGPVST